MILSSNDKLQYCHYFDGDFEIQNMHWALAIPLKNGTPVLIRDRDKPDTWLRGIYEIKRWPNDDSSFHAGIHVKSEWFTDIRWRPILDSDEVKLA